MNKILASLVMAGGLGAVAAAPVEAHDHHRPVVQVGFYVPAYRPAYYPATFVPVRDCHYDVLFRRCPADPWAFHAAYESRFAADRDAARLEVRGFQVSIRHHH